MFFLFLQLSKKKLFKKKEAFIRGIDMNHSIEMRKNLQKVVPHNSQF